MSSSDPLYLLPINTPYLSTAALSAFSDAAEIALALGRVLVGAKGDKPAAIRAKWQPSERGSAGSFWR